MNMKNRVAVVTGGAVRVGRAICLELASRGIKVLCQYHSSDEMASSLKKEASDQDRVIELLKCDLRDASSASLILNNVMNHFGRVDILVNNAALFWPTPIGTVKEEDWDTFHDLNLKRAFFLAQTISGQMKKQGAGKIINIGDTSALSPWPSYVPYATSKAGLIAMTIGLAKALAPDIQVNCINPGPVMIPDHYSEEEREKAIEKTLLKREGSAEDIAKTVRFLIEDTDYITGAVMPVDGGRHVR